MLADQVDYVVGVDPHRDSHALAIVHVLSGAVVFEATIAATRRGGNSESRLDVVHRYGYVHEPQLRRLVCPALID